MPSPSKRIRKGKRGKMSEYKSLAERIDVSKLRWLERKCLEYCEPVNLLLHLIGVIIIIYGLWINVLGWVAIGIIFPIAGHIYVMSINKKQQNKQKMKKK